MRKRVARGSSKEPDSTNADASPNTPWLAQLEPSDSESGEASYDDSETEVSGSDVEDSSDGGGRAPLSRRSGSSRDGAGGGVSSDDDFDTAVVDVLQHADPLVESPQTDAAVGRDGPCVQRLCSLSPRCICVRRSAGADSGALRGNMLSLFACLQGCRPAAAVGSR